MRGTWIQSLGWEDPLEENMATHSSILARRKNGQRSLAGCSLLGLQRVNMTEATKHSTGSMIGQVKWDRISESLENQMCVCVLAQSCPNLCDSMDCSTPGTSFYEISQARILAWVAISFSRESSWPRGWTHISCTGGQILHHWATWEALKIRWKYLKISGPGPSISHALFHWLFITVLWSELYECPCFPDKETGVLTSRIICTEPNTQ